MVVLDRIAVRNGNCVALQFAGVWMLGMAQKGRKIRV